MFNQAFFSCFRAPRFCDLAFAAALLAMDVSKAFIVAALTHNARAAVSVFSAGLSHQLRDATRRGLWLYPPRGPKTPPLGYPVYLAAQALLPLMVALCLRAGFVSRSGSFVRGETSAALPPSEPLFCSFSFVLGTFSLKQRASPVPSRGSAVAVPVVCRHTVGGSCLENLFRVIHMSATPAVCVVWAGSRDERTVDKIFCLLVPAVVKDAGAGNVVTICAPLHGAGA